MTYEIPKFELSDYPLNRADGRMELLDAETIYYWEGRYWLAILKVLSKFGEGKERVSVRVYRWKWTQGRDSGEWRWTVDQKHNINKRSLWEKEKAAIDKMFEGMTQ